MKSMKVNFCGLEFDNPLVSASGTYNFGAEFREYYDLSEIGGISVKGLTRVPRQGNPAPRIAETYGGILNAVGLQNPGVDHFLENDLPILKKEKTKIIANIAGNTIEDYIYMAEKTSDSDVDMVEMNISCPNVKAGGVAFGVIPESVYDITSKVKKVCKKPLIVKLTPNTSDITKTAKAAEDAGADAISLINTLTGMAVDIKSQRPILSNVTGGLSGPAIKPVALRMVWQAYNTVKIPIIGMGGIMTAQDVIEFMLCGASLVQVGTANLINPMAMIEIKKDLEKYLIENNIDDISQLTGALKV